MATEVDLDSTYGGGSSQLVEALLADSRLEALAVTASDRVTAAPTRSTGRASGAGLSVDSAAY